MCMCSKSPTSRSEKAEGGILRGSNGRWLAGFTFRVGVSTIMVAELWAISHGLLLGWHNGYREVLLESDSLVTINKINNRRTKRGPHHRLISAIRELIDRSWKCTIKHIYRQANMCADWVGYSF